MRLLHVTRENGPGERRFGIGRCLAPLVEALRRRGHEVHYLTQEELGPRARQLRDRAMRGARQWLRPALGEAWEMAALLWIERLNMGRLAARVATQWQADAVHLHDPLLAWGYRLRSRGAPRRWGLTEHGFGSYTRAIAEEGVAYTPRLLRWSLGLEARVLAAADFVVSPTVASRAELARQLDLAQRPDHWHAVPHARPLLPTIDRAAARAGLGWDDGRFNVLAVGRVNPVKRLPAIVQACHRLGADVRLTVLGVQDDAERQLLAPQAAPGLQLDTALVDDVAPYLAACDAYVSASRNESFGLANLEALLCGAATVCTAVGAVPEVTGGHGWLVPGDDEHLIENLAAALAGVRADPAEARRRADAAQAWAWSWPDADEIARRHEALYLPAP